MLRRGVVRMRWPDDEGDFFRRLVRMVVHLPGYHGIREARLYQPFHRPALAFHRAHSDFERGTFVRIRVTTLIGRQVGEPRLTLVSPEYTPMPRLTQRDRELAANHRAWRQAIELARVDGGSFRMELRRHAGRPAGRRAASRGDGASRARCAPQRGGGAVPARALTPARCRMRSRRRKSGGGSLTRTTCASARSGATGSRTMTLWSGTGRTRRSRSTISVTG